MTEFLRPFPEFGELQIDPETEETLIRQIDTQGRPTWNFFVGNLLFNPDVDRFLIMGQPGTGKTIKLMQAARVVGRNARVLRIPLATSFAFYEDELQRSTVPDTQQFNAEFTRVIENPRDKVVIYSENGQPIKEITFIEDPAVGKSYPKDRGLTAFRHLALTSKKTLFAYGVAHPLSQARAIVARKIVLETNVRDVVSRLAEQSIIVVSKATRDKEILGRKLKALVEPMANIDHIRIIRDEVRDLIIWHRASRTLEERAREIILPISYKPEPIRQMLLQNFGQLEGRERDYVLESLEKQASMHQEFACLEAAYAESVFRELGVPENLWRVTFSPYNPGLIHWPIDI